MADTSRRKSMQLYETIISGSRLLIDNQANPNECEMIDSSLFDVHNFNDESSLKYNRRTTNRKYTFMVRSKGTIFTCEYCSKEFRYKSKFDEHLRVHTGERPFACEHCNARFTQKGALRLHEKTHIAEKFGCQKCGKAFKTADQLELHLETHDTMDLSLQATTVDESSLNLASLTNEHYYDNSDMAKVEESEFPHDEEYLEGSPDESQITHRWHVTHVMSDGAEETHVAPESELLLARYADGRLQVNDTVLVGEEYDVGVMQYCHVLSNNEVLTFLYDSINDILEIIETNDEGIIPEEEVSQEQLHYEGTFDSSQAHYVYDEDSATASTSTFNESYPDQEETSPEYAPVEVIEIPESEALKHFSSEPGPSHYIYPIQPKIKQNAKNLEWIINAIASGKRLDEATPHKRKKPTIHQCEQCGLILKYPSKIKAHMRTHSGEKPFACHLCDRKFAMNTTLKMHIRRHAGDKKYVCNFPDCKKRFINGALLNHHITTRHYVRRKFACLQGCGQTFYNNKERERHESTCGVHDYEPDGFEYEEHVNPETGEVEKWLLVPEAAWYSPIGQEITEESDRVQAMNDNHLY